MKDIIISLWDSWLKIPKKVFIWLSIALIAGSIAGMVFL